MPKFFLFLACIFSITAQAQVKILFDASHAQTAGSADWIIDADIYNLLWGSNGPYISSSATADANAQMTPTPAQSGITANSAETFWDGGLSAWAVDCAKKNYIVSTLPYTGSFTYNNTNNNQDLSKYNILIIDEPNVLFTATEKKAIINFVSNGGSLFLIADHTISDRNGDGFDSPDVINDLFTNNGIVNNPFGMSVDLNDFSQTTSNVIASASDSIINGSFGKVTQLKFSAGTSITLDPIKNSSVKGIIYKSGASGGNTNAMCAYARYGCGKIVLLGDSSPFDDGTGDANDFLYFGYNGEVNGNHQKLAMNATSWLAIKDCNTVPNAIEALNLEDIKIYPNPAHHFFEINTNSNSPILFELYNTMGEKIITKTINNRAYFFTNNIANGIYFYTLKNENQTSFGKINIIK
jgi:Secretion system C-terminal sorting domain